MKIEIDKPVIPQFVADWIEQLYGQCFYSDDLLEVLFSRNYEVAELKIFEWFTDDKGRAVTAILYDYEVEEEQKYIIKIGNLYLAEPLGDMTGDIVRMTRDKEVAYQFTDEKSIATHLDKFEGTEAVKVEEAE